MTKVLFICHGNICRSPMAEFVMKDLVAKAGLSDQFEIASAATSTEEIGNPVYPPARRKLAEHGISCEVVEDFGEHMETLHQAGIALVINTATHGRRPERAGFKLRRWSVENGVTCLTSLDTVRALLFALHSAMEKGFDVVDLAKV